MFQSTRPRGRTRQLKPKIIACASVSIHASSREDATCYVVIMPLAWLVSIHASSREDATFRVLNDPADQGFNPRVLAGGRDIQVKWTTGHDGFQSTRPRGRTRLSLPTLSGVWPCFNPRVLAGGRDKSDYPHQRGILVSIHASSREDATIFPVAPKGYTAFQSTRPRGRTRRHRLSRMRKPMVSIHASSREDATGSPESSPRLQVSIHASSREDATGRMRAFLILSMFQSTRPRGRTRPPEQPKAKTLP